MNVPLIFAWIWAAMVATSFWESAVEGRNAWDKNKVGWKLRYYKHYTITMYHFFLFGVMWPLLLTLPLVVYGWDTRLFGILVSAYFTGLVIEDFFWFVVNPVVKFREWNPKFAGYYPWLQIGKFAVPQFYLVSILIALVSWRFLWP